MTSGSASSIQSERLLSALLHFCLLDRWVPASVPRAVVCFANAFNAADAKYPKFYQLHFAGKTRHNWKNPLHCQILDQFVIFGSL